jgi:PIN domain nuclease of toxin-antitoxin system
VESGLKLLLDPHALIGWLEGNEYLSPRARDAISDEANSIAVSAASAMEVATKYQTGKLLCAALLAQDFETIVAQQGFIELATSIRHARLAGEINIFLKDPFDRFLIAQTHAEGMALVSNEALFDAVAVNRFW